MAIHTSGHGGPCSVLVQAEKSRLSAVSFHLFRTAIWSIILYICSRIDRVFLSYEAFVFNVIPIRGRQEQESL